MERHELAEKPSNPKLKKIQQPVRQAKWARVARRLQRRLDPVLAPLYEVSSHARDTAVHAYWDWRKTTNRLPFDRAAGFSVGPTPKGGERPKNVVWVMLDALRQDIFEEYLRRGGLADLVDEGVYFSRAFAQGSWTYPSVFSFLTGRYPFNCGVSRLTDTDGVPGSVCADFDDTCPTIFRLLRDHDYRVGSILDGWGFTVRTTAGLEHREDRYFEENWGWICGQSRRYLSLDELREASLAYIESAGRQSPFVLFVRSLYTHSPYRGIFKSAEYVTNLSRERSVVRLMEGFIRGLRRFEGDYLRPMLEVLEQAGKRDDTIIVINSDHGDMFWNVEDDLRTGDLDEEMWRHQLEPYNALIKVPLLITGARMKGVYSQRFRLIDVVPTLLEELGIEYEPAQFDGVSVRRVEARPLYADSAGVGFGGVAFQAGGPKLLMSHRLGTVSYPITEDQYERLNLRRDAGIYVNEFTEFLEQASRSRHVEADQDDAEVLLRRLQMLGYIE
ncbi:MAG: sulfatase-like hydrolase/transferase [Ardenticatenaceae bacterium]|nr:sulfatase-like hydrolase/transferase [Ardenticatenaceae bacterium]